MFAPAFLFSSQILLQRFFVISYGNYVFSVYYFPLIQYRLGCNGLSCSISFWLVDKLVDGLVANPPLRIIWMINKPKPSGNLLRRPALP